MSDRPLPEDPQNIPTPQVGTPSPFHQLPERVASLERSVATLAEAGNANAAAFRDCLEITEARQWMIMRAMDDMVAGTVKKQVSTPNSKGEDAVDWDHYTQEYGKFQERLRAEATPNATVEGELPADAVVFGGGGI